jgi:nicotinamidase-related amidase
LSITNLTHEFRRFGKPVIWVRQEFKPDLSDAFPVMRRRGISITIEGTHGCQLLPELEPGESDLVIVKKRYSAFYGTTLDDIMAHLRPRIVALAGINTHACIRMTAIDAYQRDYEVVVASDCVASHDADHERVSLRYLGGKIAQLMSNAELCNLVRSESAA